MSGDARYSSPYYEKKKEEIVFQIDPSAELIPDEYDIDVRKASVHFFVGQNDEYNCERITHVLHRCGYPLVEKHQLKTKSEVERDLNKISKIDYTEKSCLIIFIMGRTRKDKSGSILPDREMENGFSIRDVWNAILCPSLRNKPKIIYFQAAVEKKRIGYDGGVIVDGKYDVPIEADFLVIYKMSEETNKDAFIESLCHNIEHRGERDDLIHLITHSKCALHDKRPVVISTLTRQFFLINSSLRGYDYDIKRAADSVMRKVKRCSNQLRPSSLKPSRSQVDSIADLPATPVPVHKSTFSSWPELHTLQEVPVVRPRKQSVSTRPRKPWRP